MLGFTPLASATLADTGVQAEEFSISADAGNFNLTGQSVSLLINNEVNSETFSLTGQSVSFTVTRLSESGSFALTGQDVDLLLGQDLTAESGSFSTTGQAVNFNITHTVDVTSNPSGATSVNYDVSVATGTNNYGSGNKYYIDGLVGASPTLQLMAGVTYRFRQDSSTNSNHPIRFSTTPNGTHAGGAEYTTGVTTNGVPGESGSYTEITPTTSTPRLFYYCANHPNMGGVASANGGIHTARAQDADLVKALNLTADIGTKEAQVLPFFVGHPLFGTYDRYNNTSGFFFLGQRGDLGSFTDVIQPNRPSAELNVERKLSAESGSFGLTDHDVSFNVTALFERGTFLLTGLPHNKAISELARHVTLAFTGQDASFTITRQSDVGTFSTTGQDVSFALNMPVDPATFAVSGKDASLIKDLNLTADKADFVLTGQAAVFGIQISAAHASVILTGQDVSLNKAVNVAANTGSFALTGQDALKGISEVGAAVSYGVTGFNVQFNIKLAADNGTFTLAGQDALKGISELAAAVTYTLTGQDAAFAIQITMIVDSASFTLTGQDAEVKFILNRAEFAGAKNSAIITDKNQAVLSSTSVNSVELVDENTATVTTLSPNDATLNYNLNEAA